VTGDLYRLAGGGFVVCQNGGFDVGEFGVPMRRVEARAPRPGDGAALSLSAGWLWQEDRS